MNILDMKINKFLGEKDIDFERELKHAEDTLSKYKIASYREKDEDKLEAIKNAITHWKPIIKELKKAVKDSDKKK